MKIKNKLLRILILPLGLFYGVVKLSNNKARDIHNRLRFKENKIDDDCNFDSNVVLGKHARICKGVTLNNVKVGAYSYINYGCLIQHAKIGNYCSIAHDVKIGLGAHPTHLFSTSPLFYKKKNTFGIQVVEKDLEFEEYKDTIIGNDVWIGANVIINDGVTIGNGAIIAAGAVVTKDVPSYTVFGGIPAKILKSRLDVEKLQLKQLKNWWKLGPHEVYKIISEKS